MNREIKFRAWVKEDSEMKGYMVPHDSHELNYSELIDVHNENGCTILMQYTGLKDKNGKEVYEGDYNQHGEVVIFCNECNGYQFALYDFPTKEFIFCHNCEGNFMFQDGISDIKIIGNIYENPELLNA